jgi:hypothetical protein
MSILMQTPVPRYRDNFPGEIQIIIRSQRWHDSQFPCAVACKLIEYNYATETPLLVTSNTGPWQIYSIDSQPVVIEMGTSDTQQLTAEDLIRNFTDLSTIVGAELALELHTHMLATLSEFDPQADMSPQRQLQFEDPRQYNQLIIALWERYTYTADAPFSQLEALQTISNVWTNERTGPEAWLSYLAHQRYEPGIDADVFEAEIETFCELIATGRPATQQQIATFMAA